MIVRSGSAVRSLGGSVAIDVSVMRRGLPRLLQAATCAAAIAVVAAAGCDRASDLSDDQEIPAAPMSEDGFVEHMAALTLAVEDGLTGEEARGRAAELGAVLYARDEIEAFADILRADPERWAGVAVRIDRRIADLRGAGAGGLAQSAPTGESHSDPDAAAPAEPTGTGESRGDPGAGS